MSGTLVLSRNDVARSLPLRALASKIGDAYIRHSVSISKSQCDLLFGSFQSFTASSTVRLPG